MLNIKTEEDLSFEDEFAEAIAEWEKTPIEGEVEEVTQFDTYDQWGNQIDSSDYIFDDYGRIVGKAERENVFKAFYDAHNVLNGFRFMAKTTADEDIEVKVEIRDGVVMEKIGNDYVDIGIRGSYQGYRWLRVKTKRKYVYGKMNLNRLDDECESGDIKETCLEGCVCAIKECSDCADERISEVLEEEVEHRGVCDRIMTDDSAIIAEHLVENGKEWVHKPTIVSGANYTRLWRLFCYDYVLRDENGILEWIGQQYRDSPISPPGVYTTWCCNGVRMLPLVTKEGEEWLFDTYNDEVISVSGLRNTWYFSFRNQLYSTLFYHEIYLRGEKKGVIPLRKCENGNLCFTGVFYRYSRRYDPEDNRYEACSECVRYVYRKDVKVIVTPSVRFNCCINKLQDYILTLFKRQFDIDDARQPYLFDSEGFFLYVCFLLGYSSDGRSFYRKTRIKRIPCYFSCCLNNPQKAQIFIRQELSYK